MAILNEWAIMGPNHYMLVVGALFLVAGISMSIAALNKCDRFGEISFAIVISVALTFGGSWLLRNWSNPDFEIPTGKKYIEATFANGSPTAAILEKYDVIGREGKVWYLVTKDGVKDEKRAKVRIYEEEAE